MVKPLLRELVVFVLTACASLACSPGYGDAFMDSFRAGQRALDAGRYEEAVARFAQAEKDALRLKDRDEAVFMQARMHEKLGKWTAAQEDYARLAKISPTGPRTARAAYASAWVDIEHGDAARGWKALGAAVERYPNHGGTRRALPDLADHLREEIGEDAMRAELERLRRKLDGTDLEQHLDYEIAKSLERAGELRRAHDLFLETARRHPYPSGSLTDDAYLRASMVAEARGDPAQAIADLRELLAAREIATGFSYERPRYPEAQLRIGTLYRDGLHDLDAARRELRLVYTDHATSVLADDAMWQEALVALQQGDAPGACAIATDFAERFPESRFRRCLREICPAAPAGDRPCPPYIRAQLPGADIDDGSR
jgi:tetratricopeptide (TPR) repeat protein